MCIIDTLKMEDLVTEIFDYHMDNFFVGFAVTIYISFCHYI